MLYRVSEDGQLRDSGLNETQVCGSVTYQLLAHGSLLQVVVKSQWEERLLEDIWFSGGGLHLLRQ